MSIFTRRHYIWLASVGRDIADGDQSERAIYVLADALAAESPGFDREMFLKNIFNPIEPASLADSLETKIL